MSLEKAYQMSIADGVIQAKLNPNHELLVLADRIDWERLVEVLSAYFSKAGRHAKPIRLMVGAHLLKHMHNLSDEQVARRLSGDIYWMAFCGVSDAFSSPEWKPLDASTMTNFRKRLGADGMRFLESLIRDQLIAEGKVNAKSQFVDTTAMEKNIEYPTDTSLLNKGRERVIGWLRKLSKLRPGVRLPRTFSRLAKRALVGIAKLGKDRKERIEQGARELLHFAKEALKAVPAALRQGRKRKNESEQDLIERLQEMLKRDAALLEKVIEQTEARLGGKHINGKVYSFHEPQTTCIAKGKRSKPNEYGSKVSLSVDRNGYVVCHQEYEFNIGDTTSLPEAVDGWTQATGQPPDELAADRGYHANDYPEAVKEINRLAIPT